MFVINIQKLKYLIKKTFVYRFVSFLKIYNKYLAPCSLPHVKINVGFKIQISVHFLGFLLCSHDTKLHLKI